MNTATVKKWTSTAIRDAFFDFFKSKEHQFIRSAPVVSNDDPTLLFTNAGMNQFKPIFLGDNKNNLSRVYNSQKCIRVSGKHNDLEVVGKDTYHHTFFEMLGNWSFGNYYKKEAIEWAWELLTEVWGLPKNRLFVTVHHSDDEAFELWSKVTDIDKHRILKFGDKDNFWEMGDVGPCGPCSEIHFDKGDLATQEASFSDVIEGVNGENARYIEIWNLVFIQYSRLASGDLEPLPAKHIDTGMGFERICAVLQDVESNYDTDIFAGIIDSISRLSGKPYDRGAPGMSHRVIADHLRALSFAIADGALPGNEGRGYVLRRILRRASRYARNLDQKEPFICKLVPVLVELMGDAFPELKERQNFIIQVIQSEEERFIKTLDQGLEKIKKLAEKAKADSKDSISGEDAFTLYDTFGFPLDLTRLIAEEHGLSVDEEGYQKHMKAQNERARKAAKFDNIMASDENWTIIDESKDSVFLGYEQLDSNATLSRFCKDDKFSYVVLNQTPFYSESGGQIGDTGFLKNDWVELEVVDCFKVLDMVVHKCIEKNGELDASHPQLEAQVTGPRRSAIMKNHSATHLLQAALQKVLGDHVQQQGSRVAAEDLRFDFTHFSAMTEEEISKVESLVNEQIQNALPVSLEMLSFDEAQKKGAMALFGEKYGDVVRVISMGEFSMELCGGTHVSNTGHIGLFKITKETSIAAGVRRIEAITGMQALNWLNQKSSTLDNIAGQLKIKPGQELEKILELNDRLKESEKQLAELKKEKALSAAKQIWEGVEKLGEANFIAKSLSADSHFQGLDKKQLSELMDGLHESMPKNTIAVFTYVSDNNLSLFSLVEKSLHAKIKAGDMVKELGKLADGKGGGRPDRAQAGCRKLDAEPQIFVAAREMASKAVGS